tara:strand:+ start:642 stop:1253 length:612 start_codon:yes stop_codon:yes gene_type:complete
MNENNIIGVILAGGKSSRFGTDKSKIKLGHKTLIEHTISKIEKDFSEILIVSKKQNFKITKKNIFIIEDYIKGHLGPLVGVLSAMKWIKKEKKKYKWIATFPCDTPFFDRQIINQLNKASENKTKKLFFFKSGEKRHNIFGLWSIELIDVLEKDINNNYRKVELWADKIGFEIININTSKFDSFLNINTKDDFEKAKQNLDKI